jgi:hypothetical protein
MLSSPVHLAALLNEFGSRCAALRTFLRSSLALVYITTYRTYKFLHSIFLLFKILSGVRDLEI